MLPYHWGGAGKEQHLKLNTGNTCLFVGDRGMEQKNRTGITFLTTVAFSFQDLYLSNCPFLVSGPSITYSLWFECSFPQSHEGYEPFGAFYPSHILTAKDRAWPHLSVLFRQLFTAWQSQVPVLLLPGLPLSIWVQDRSNIQLFYCVIWQPLSPAPAWIYRAEQTVVCQKVSSHRNIGFTILAYHSASNSRHCS